MQRTGRGGTGRVLLTLAVLLLAALAVTRGWLPLPRVRPPTGGEEPPFRYEPVELPSDFRTTLVVWDYDWPGWEGGIDLREFSTEPMTPRSGYARELEAVLQEFAARYPHVQVEVRLLSFVDGPAEAALAAARGQGPDVLAVWWAAPRPPADQLVPVTPFLEEGEAESYHPLAWDLASADGEVWAWPRWVALHYWLLNRPAGGENAPVAAGGVTDGIGEEGWTVADAARFMAEAVAEAPVEGPPFLTVPAATAVAAELLAGAESINAEALAQGLTLLREAAGSGAALSGPIARLEEGEFLLAGGLGPALAAWPFLPPPGSSGDWQPAAYLPVPPPAPGGEAGPGSLPVVSLGAYVVPRRGGEGPAQAPEQVQVSMELARLLSQRASLFPVGRMLALPAYLDVLGLWRDRTGLAAVIADGLVADAGRAAVAGYRDYPPRGVPVGPQWADHERLRQVLERFWRGEADARDVTQVLWPDPIPTPN